MSICLLALGLTRSASLSEKELREARVRSQIIAAQLTVPTGSSSRGVQLFNRRRQRVNAFTLESCGEGLGEDRADSVKSKPSSNKQAWSEWRAEEKDSGLNFKNNGAEQHLLQPGVARSLSDSPPHLGKVHHMEEDPADHIIQERHFLPVKEEQDEDDEEEETRGNVPQELEVEVKDENPVGSNEAGGGDEINGSHSGSALRGKLLNGCHSTSEPGKASLSAARQATTIINRTARPFFSPVTVQSPGATSPVMDVPAPPSYATPPLPAFPVPQTVPFSPPPPPPSYPTPPLPSLPGPLPESNPSSPPPMSPATSPLPSHFPSSNDFQISPAPSCGPPTAPKPSSFVPQHIGEMKPIPSAKTGILEESAARRSNKKAMFTFKEKPIVSPNPELLSLVQGVDEKKKNLHRSIPEPAPEEELLALGAEASNFFSKEATKVEEVKAPEWASCLKSSRTRPRTEHRPEQTLTNVSGKGAELFAKRQSRMEKYVVEKKNDGHIRSPSPTMSLPPSWVYPSNMPGRVKAIVKNSDISTQLTQNLKAQQAVKQIPRQKAKAPEPMPEPAPLENGCSKIEMDLARHQPYQLDSSLFIIKPVRDPLCTLPRSAPKSKSVTSGQYFSRQASLPNNSQSQFRFQSKPPQMPLMPTSGRGEIMSSPDPGQPRSSSSMATFSTDRVPSSHSGVQAPRPTFSAKKAGIAAQVWRPSLYYC